MIQITEQHNESKLWKNIFLGLSVFIIILMPLLSHNYGQSGDEWEQIEYGQHIWNYFTKGDPQALDYSNNSLQYHGLEYYGGLYDFSMESLHHLMPSIPIVILRHFFNALTGALMMLFTGLLVFRFSKKWSIATLSLLFIFFSPRIFGESMNNPKDIPFACGFIMGIYYLVSLIQDFPKHTIRHAVGLGLGFTIAYGVRPAGGMLLVAYMVIFVMLYYLLNKETRNIWRQNNNKLLKRLLITFVIVLGIGYVIGMACWPWGLQSPLSRPFEALKGMTNRTTQILVLFDGSYYSSVHMPAIYEFKWIVITSPVIVLIGMIAFILCIMPARRQYGLFAMILLLFCAFFPLLYMIYKKSTVYDTWRHVFFVYPFWAALAALGFDMVSGLIKNRKLQWLPIAIAAAGLIPLVIWTITSHPNQYTYFNELQGGVEGAYTNYDIDYYQNTSLQAAKWIEQNAKPVPGRKTLVLSNMTGFDHYFAKDTSWIVSGYGRYETRSIKDWDYYIENPRYLSQELLQDYNWTKLQGVVHIISVHGVPLCIIIKRLSTAGIAANDALQKKDYATAVAKYEEYLKADTTDDFVWSNYAIALAYSNRIDESIHAAQKATQLDPGNPQYFQLLGQLYHAKGDDADAQRAMNTVQSMVAREQELAGEQNKDNQ